MERAGDSRTKTGAEMRRAPCCTAKNYAAVDNGLRFARACRIVAIQNRVMETPLSHTHYVEVLGVGAGTDPGLLGGKGASLCRLVSLGHRVPIGFVITRFAFQSALEEMGLAPAIERLSSMLGGSEDMTALANQIRETILSRPIPSPILEPVRQNLETLRLWDPPSEGVIIRSSATIEDGSAHSFAGIFESIPISAPEEFEPTVRQIWASVFAPRALS